MAPGDTNSRRVVDERSLKSILGRRSQAREAYEAKFCVLSRTENSKSCKITVEKCALDLTKTSS